MTYKLELFLILKKRLINIKLFKKFVCVCVCVTYKLELFLVLQKKKKRLINIKLFKNYVFYGLLILDSLFFILN